MASEETNDDAEIALGREFQAKRWKLKAYHFLIKICKSYISANLTVHHFAGNSDFSLEQLFWSMVREENDGKGPSPESPICFVYSI